MSNPDDPKIHRALLILCAVVALLVYSCALHLD